jgi:hypothetical protein
VHAHIDPVGSKLCSVHLGHYRVDRLAATPFGLLSVNSNIWNPEI